MFSRIAIAFVSMGLLLWTFFSYPVFLEILHYKSYTQAIKADSIDWSIQPINDELWKAVAHFRYTVDGHVYQKEELFAGGRYKNPYAANMAINELKQTYQTVWYNPLRPQFSTLEKFFPLKKLIYALISLALLLYGIWISTHLTNRMLNHSMNTENEKWK